MFNKFLEDRVEYNMEKKMKAIETKLKSDIAFILIMGIMFLCVGGSRGYSVMRYAKVPASAYEVKMSEDNSYYVLYVEEKEIGYVDYNEYCSITNGMADEYADEYVKYIYVGNLAKDLIRFIFMSFALFCIYMIFDKIKKGESPFQKSSVIYLRVAGIFVFCEGFVACVAKYLIIIIGTDEMMINLLISQQDIFLIIFGVIIAMISEIFKYGCELQEDSDLIA